MLSKLRIFGALLFLFIYFGKEISQNFAHSEIKVASAKKALTRKDGSDIKQFQAEGDLCDLAFFQDSDNEDDEFAVSIPVLFSFPQKLITPSFRLPEIYILQPKKFIFHCSLRIFC